MSFWGSKPSAEGDSQVLNISLAELAVLMLDLKITVRFAHKIQYHLQLLEHAYSLWKSCHSWMA